MTTRPDSFLPQVDIIKSDEFYRIYMEVPGLSKDDIEIYRQNVMTIIKGVKKPCNYLILQNMKKKKTTKELLRKNKLNMESLQ